MSFTLQRRLTTPFAILAISSLLLVGCASVDTGGSGPEPAGTADGVVTVFGSLTGPEAQLLEQSWADWEQENNIDIRYESSDEFEAQIDIRVQAGKAPDLAIFAQPKLFKDLVARDLIQRAPATVKANVKRYWSQDWANYTTRKGVIYGAPLLAEVKNYIWYLPAQFAANGWKVPTSWQGLLDLTETMQATLQKAPWCAAFESGSDQDQTSGGAGTDWVDSVVLGLQGPDAYDRWVGHDLKFSDPAISDSFEALGTILKNPAYVNAGLGDPGSINTASTEDLARAMADGTCSLTQQGPLFEALLTDPEIGNSTVGPNQAVWAFLTPSAAAGGNSVVGGGGIVAAFSNDADTIKVQEYLSSPEWAESRVTLGGAVSASNGVNPASAPSLVSQLSIRLLQDARTTFRFSSVELMPAAVVRGSFAAGVGKWIEGRLLHSVLAAIDASWPPKK